MVKMHRTVRLLSSLVEQKAVVKREGQKQLGSGAVLTVAAVPG